MKMTILYKCIAREYLLLIFMSDIFFLYMRDVLLIFYYPPFRMFYDLNKFICEKKNMKNAFIYSGAPVNLKP